MRTVDALQERELSRVPLGATVKVRGCPGLGVGRVTARETVVAATKWSDEIPIVGRFRADVTFGSKAKPYDFERDTFTDRFDSTELLVVSEVA